MPDESESRIARETPSESLPPSEREARDRWTRLLSRLQAIVRASESLPDPDALATSRPERKTA